MVQFALGAAPCPHCAVLAPLQVRPLVWTLSWPVRAVRRFVSPPSGTYGGGPRQSLIVKGVCAGHRPFLTGCWKRSVNHRPSLCWFEPNTRCAGSADHATAERPRSPWPHGTAYRRNAARTAAAVERPRDRRSARRAGGRAGRSAATAARPAAGQGVVHAVAARCLPGWSSPALRPRASAGPASAWGQLGRPHTGLPTCTCSRALLGLPALMVDRRPSTSQFSTELACAVAHPVPSDLRRPIEAFLLLFRSAGQGLTHSPWLPPAPPPIREGFSPATVSRSGASSLTWLADQPGGDGPADR